ncbi:MAG: hypothetical protein ABFS56_31190 [Pseudomonadota bacterium]
MTGLKSPFKNFNKLGIYPKSNFPDGEVRIKLFIDIKEMHSNISRNSVEGLA